MREPSVHSNGEESLHNPSTNMPQNRVTLDYALSPDTARQGDVICALRGCETPVLLRSVGKHYQVLGQVSICDVGSFQMPPQYSEFILC